MQTLFGYYALFPYERMLFIKVHILSDAQNWLLSRKSVFFMRSLIYVSQSAIGHFCYIKAYISLEPIMERLISMLNYYYGQIFSIKYWKIEFFIIGGLSFPINGYIGEDSINCTIPFKFFTSI